MMGRMMNASARNRFHTKAKKLLQLYSLWHETHREDVQRDCLKLLAEILAVEPHFQLRSEFQKAF